MSMEDYNFAKAREAWATPVKIVQYNCTCGKTMKFVSENGVIAPQRTWVGLTNNELQPIADEYRILFGSWVEDFARAIEAKLKEKNT